MIDLRRLEALVALQRTGSVSAAAQELHYGQPTVSHHLRRLEAETGSVLLQRVGRGVRLTAEGERLARRGEEILGLLERAETELAASTSLQSGHVRVAAFPSAAATVVPAAIAILAGRHPGIQLELTEAEPPEAGELLRAGRADLALTFSYPGQPETEGLTSTAVLTDPLHLVTADDDPRSLAARPRLEDFADSRWITGCERCRTQLMHLCAEAGFTPTIAFASDDYVAVQSLVAAGLGVTLLPALALRAHRRSQVRTRPIPGGDRTIQVTSYGAPPRPAVVDAVATALAEAAARPE